MRIDDGLQRKTKRRQLFLLRRAHVKDNRGVVARRRKRRDAEQRRARELRVKDVLANEPIAPAELDRRATVDDVVRHAVPTKASEHRKQ